jgi:hypothetical protein
MNNNITVVLNKINSQTFFVDNNNAGFYDWFDKLAKEHGIAILKSSETCMTPPIDENKHDLGEYFDKFGYPKLKANVAYRIGRKGG